MSIKISKIITDSKYYPRHVVMFTLSLFFWFFADGIISFVTPIVIVNAGFSDIQMGIIYGTSSLAGAIFDLILGKFINRVSYKRLFLISFAIFVSYPFLLWNISSFWLFILLMALWGIYYDLINFGTYNFISTESEKDNNAYSFGLVNVFMKLGYFLGPVVGSLIIITLPVIQRQGLIIFLDIIGLILFINTIFYIKKENNNLKIPYAKEDRLINFKTRKFHHLWWKIGKRLYPVLIFVVMIYVLEAFYWTIGPLLSKNYPDSPWVGGAFVTFATIPGLISSLFVGRLAKSYGKKKTAFVAMCISVILLISLAFISNIYLILAIVFVSSLIGAVAKPSIDAAFSDYIFEGKSIEPELIAIEDFATNFGYIIGPMIAGLISHYLGILPSFSVIASLILIITVVLMFITPKEIKVKDLQ